MGLFQSVLQFASNFHWVENGGSGSNGCTDGGSVDARASAGCCGNDSNGAVVCADSGVGIESGCSIREMRTGHDENQVTTLSNSHSPSLLSLSGSMIVAVHGRNRIEGRVGGTRVGARATVGGGGSEDGSIICGGGSDDGTNIGGGGRKGDTHDTGEGGMGEREACDAGDVATSSTGTAFSFPFLDCSGSPAVEGAADSPRGRLFSFSSSPSTS